MYIRFQSPPPDQRGVFFLVNGLAKAGKLTVEQEAFRRENNDWYDAAYANPTTLDPAVYDTTVNPGAVAWFKVTAERLVSRVDGYLEILRAHGVTCETVRSADPGKIVYEDDEQIVVVPY